MNKLMGWDIHQWAMACAAHEGEIPRAIDDVVDIRLNWWIMNRYDPDSYPSKGRDIAYNFDLAIKIFEIATQHLIESGVFDEDRN